MVPKKQNSLSATAAIKQKLLQQMPEVHTVINKMQQSWQLEYRK